MDDFDNITCEEYYEPQYDDGFDDPSYVVTGCEQQEYDFEDVPF